ncbi:MAG: hypothetical protein NC121_09765 [Blautia sp.]|nr:hypothetical protein [Blautia sp.]
MKVQELRNLLSSSDREHLEKAFVECYKQLRKGQKEEIDQGLIDLLQGRAVEQRKAEDSVNFEELEQQIVIFLQNAYEQNYFAPNRVIPKNQRPKWRFMVKNFIKELEKIPPESGNYPQAVKLLTDLYCLLCRACQIYLFSTEDPFRSIGWGQSKLFALLVSKTFAAGYSRESISNLLLYAATGGLSRESLYIEQELALLNGLRTSDVKYMAMEEAQKLVEERTGRLAALKQNDNRRYDLREAVNELCNMILLISISLAEPEKGVEYYFKHSMERDREITLYRALEIVDIMDEDDLWLKVYEYGVRKKIRPRERLRQMYEERKRQSGG